MSQKNLSNQAASVAARLLQRSRSTGEDHQALLTRYGLERLMYRLSQSALASRFVVKSKQAQWAAFIRRTHARMPDGLAFKVVVEEISAFLLPPLLAAGKSETFLLKWQKDGPWT